MDPDFTGAVPRFLVQITDRKGKHQGVRSDCHNSSFARTGSEIAESVGGPRRIGSFTALFFSPGASPSGTAKTTFLPSSHFCSLAALASVWEIVLVRSAIRPSKFATLNAATLSRRAAFLHFLVFIRTPSSSSSLEALHKRRAYDRAALPRSAYISSTHLGQRRVLAETHSKCTGGYSSSQSRGSP